MTSAKPPLVTAEELLLIPEEHARCDLIRGEVVWTPFLWMSEGMVKDNLLFALGNYVDQHDLGIVLPTCGFILERDSDTVLGPDVSFTRHERLPPKSERDGYIPGSPDLAVEVVCHDEVAGYVVEKIALYLTAGTPLLWVLEPTRRFVLEYRDGQPARVLRPSDTLDAGDVLPGFTMSGAKLFVL